MKAILALVSLVVLGQAAFADWTPPEKPDPTAILKEAQADARAQRYADALAKHVWYHENAIKIQPSQTGVRLSFALLYWKQLGAVYPIALGRLKDIRDGNERAIRGGKGSVGDFSDLTAINRTLDEEAKTKELFVWVDAHDKALAPKVYRYAEPALIRAGEYRACAPYLKTAEYAQTIAMYRQNLKMALNGAFGTQMKVYGETTFLNRTGTLIALLVVNNRKAEADGIAEQALKEWDDQRMKDVVSKAMSGVVPPPYP